MVGIEMSGKSLPRCTRCSEENKTHVLYTARPGGYAMMLQPSPEDGPKVEQVCRNCITDDEIFIALGPAVEFVLEKGDSTR
jgi:hypothetical protein